MRTTLQTAAPETDKKEFQAQASSAIVEANTLQVSNAAEANTAADLLKAISSTKKSIEDKRKEYTAPLVAAQKSINADFKKMTEPFEQAEKIVKSKIATFHDAEQKRLAEERRKEAEAAAEKARKEAEEAAKERAAQAQDEDEKKRIESQAEQEAQAAAEAAALATEEAAKKAEPKMEGNRGKAVASKVWTFEITDEAKIPREFCVVHEPAIRAAIKDGAREIAGVRIYQETRISSR